MNEALSQGISYPEGKSHALNLRGSFRCVRRLFSIFVYAQILRFVACTRFLWGDSTGASEDLDEAIKTFPSFTQNYVKIASVHMEQGKAAEAFAAFEEAIKHDASDPDIYYHRGQGS